MRSHKILKFKPLDLPRQNELSRQLRISRILAQLLVNRGLGSAPEAEKFLHTDTKHFLDPYKFEGMPSAVNLIKKAAKNKDKVMVFGDYDVDGITALVLLKNRLSQMGLEVAHYLPHRIKEGYGLNKNIVKVAKEKHIKLLITVDCGTNSHPEIEALRRNNIEVIVTDHHEPLNHELPPASSIINPKLKGSTYPYRDLAGVGVAYKLCQALAKDLLLGELDLVSLGTIADVAPLTGENRLIVKKGLNQIADTQRAGLRALIEVSGIKDKLISSRLVSFILGPRINASGRMDTAEVSLNLLLSEKEDEARDLAEQINLYNRQRQKIENVILEEANDLISREINFKDHSVIILAKEGWHQGVLGIVASKIADKFYRPTILISETSDLCKGSARSIANFHIFNTLLECKELLETFGGHSHAAGLVIRKKQIKDFKHKINQLAREKLYLEDLIPSLEIDMEINLADVDDALIEELKILEPFGEGNPEPLFFSRSLQLKSEPQVLSRDTLKFWVSDGKTTCQVVGFGLGGLKPSLLGSERFDLVYTPKVDSWQGIDSVCLEAKDIIFG